VTNDLLTLHDIAEMYRVSYRQARDVITKHPSFPKPVPACSRKKPLWLRDMIEAFVRGQMSHA